MKKYLASLLALLVLVSLLTPAYASPLIKMVTLDKNSLMYGDSFQYTITRTQIGVAGGEHVKTRIINISTGTASEWSDVTLEGGRHTNVTGMVQGHPFDKKGDYLLQLNYRHPTLGITAFGEFQMLDDADQASLQGKPHLLSPHEQSDAGMLVQDIKCKEGLQLVIEARNQLHNYLPACVKPDTSIKLDQRGWSVNANSSQKISTIDCNVRTPNAFLNNCDLQGKDLSGIDLSFSSMFGADLKSADLHGVNLVKADLRNANLTRANLSNADLSLTDLRESDLSAADLSGANLESADLRGTILKDTKLVEANLSTASLILADLSGADLSKAVLDRTTLEGAHLMKANLHDAMLADAILRSADLTDAELDDANLVGANLSGADLSGADLNGADLSGANLSGANLHDADIANADMSGAYGRCINQPICETLSSY